MVLSGDVEGPVRGSLVIDSTDTQVTFVATTLASSTGLPVAGVSSPNATSGVLPPDNYAVILDSGRPGIETANGQLLDGDDSGAGGTSFIEYQQVNNSADVAVIVPSFARGPSGSRTVSTVNVANLCTPIAAAAAEGLTESGTTVTVTTTVANGLAAGDPVTISGAGNTGYDGTFTVLTVPTATTFTYTDSTAGLANPGGGTAALARGIPVSLTGPTAGVTSGQFTLTYNSALLSISGASVDPGLAASYGATLTYNTALSSPGAAVIDFSATSPLPSATTNIAQASESGNTVTITTATSANLAAGQTVTIASFFGVRADVYAGYNGSFTVLSVPNSTTFTYTDTATGLGTCTNTGTVNIPILLGGLMATVPSGAFYKSKDLLHFSSVSLSTATASVPAIGADALHLVAFPGDVSGSGCVCCADVLAVEQVLAGVSAGFAPYPLVDPNLIGDLAGWGPMVAFDSGLLIGYINQVTTPQMPTYPGRPANMLSGPDPTVSIPSSLQLGSDGSVTVPVNIDDPHPAGSTGMVQATLALSYDPAVLSVSPSDIQLGAVPASGSGWTLESTVDPAASQIGVTIWSPTPIASSAAGSLVTIVFHRTDAPATGSTAIDLVPSVDLAGSGVILTQVDDNQGPYTLTPAPTEGFDPQIDGLVNLGGGGATDAAPAVLPQLAASVVAGPVGLVGAGAAGAVAPIHALMRSNVSAGAARVPQHLADGLFSALGRGAVDAAELAILGSGAEQSVGQALAAEMSAAGSAQANLDRLLWESGDSSWLDGQRHWLS